MEKKIVGYFFFIGNGPEMGFWQMKTYRLTAPAEAKAEEKKS